MMTTARELLEAALNSGVLMHATSPKDVIQTNTPGLSVDGALMRQRLVEGIAATPSGAELLRRADEPRVVECYACSLRNATCPWHGDATPAPRPPEPDRTAALVALGERWDREIGGHRQVDDPWNRGLADGMSICAADVRHLLAATPEPAPVAESDRTAALWEALRDIRSQAYSPHGFYPWARSALVQALVNVNAIATAALAATPEPTPGRGWDGGGVRQRLFCWVGRHAWYWPVHTTEGKLLHICARCGAVKWTTPTPPTEAAK